MKWLVSATALAVADLVPAALSLAVLLPVEGLPGPTGFVAIFMAALALGHMANLPGGVGPFEATLLLALPAVPTEDLAAAILVWRALYYLPTGALALVLAARARPHGPGHAFWPVAHSRTACAGCWTPAVRPRPRSCTSATSTSSPPRIRAPSPCMAWVPALGS
ncbi:hypothetical protein LVO79_02225 [Roseivivax marinus]|uniref:hypothetical protein n=1 Tax=Roseivivax marinus TaxID=1379903 RepID=UPI001F03921F|nr:hypothetical protein [Roseivivax marinus]UMA65308.1 hypothetical protein LVO79_02225 [Roseivivax marinus]